MRARLLILAVVLTALAIFAPAAGAATTHVVNATGDQPDANLNDNVCAIAGGDCTLRAAIQQANAMSGGGAPPHTINFAAGLLNTSINSSGLDAITTNATVVNGCSASPAAAQPCVGLRSTADATGTGIDVEASGGEIHGLAISRFATGILGGGPGLVVQNSNIGAGIDDTTVEGMSRGIQLTSSGARIGGQLIGQGNYFTGNGAGLHIWGADSTGVYGNRFGLRRDGVISANDRAIVIAGQAFGPLIVNEAEGNVIGAQSNATNDEDGASCSGYCNLIAGSNGTVGAGIDLAGNGAEESPAGGGTIAGNWIGLDASGNAAANEVAIRVGDGGKTVGDDTAGFMIGGPTPSHGNLISGNAAGIDQSGGTGTLNVLSNVFGLGRDLDVSVPTAMPNGGTNATLGGTTGAEVYVQYNHFGATAKGLVLTGPRPIVIGNFFTPRTGTYSVAALEVGPGASDALIGTNQGGCIPLPAGCNAFGSVAPDVPAIWIRGADGARVSSNQAGYFFAPPLAGPPVLITDGPSGQTTSGARIGDETQSIWNTFVRSAGPAVVVSGSATGVVVAGNVGIAGNYNDPASLFTDLQPGAGLGNSGQVNGGIQPPAVGTATSGGIGGTGTPGAVIRVLQQWRADDPSNGIDGPGEGYTVPTDPATTTVAQDGRWSLAFTAELPVGQKLTASQTTAAGSSEYAPLRTTTAAPDLPVAQITSGPTGIVTERSATFTFTTPTPGAGLECSLDGAAFAPCTSPATVGPLEAGGHQFRVQARVGQQASLPASRTWSIDLPLTAGPPGSGTPGPTANSSQRFTSLVTLPSTRRCVSRRKLRLRLNKPTGARIVFAEIRVTGKRTRTVSGKALSAAIDLRGLPKGKVRVRVRVVLSNGRVINGTRTYRTCAVKKRR